MIPLSSDTETKPTDGMRKAMTTAEVGDEQKGEDPTVNRLNLRVADLLGMEAALFFPGGSMCNFVSVKVHTNPADVIFADHMAHIIRAESAGIVFSSGVLVEPIFSDRGIFSGEDLQKAIGKVTTIPNPYSPLPKLVCLEQTHNFGGGSVWSIEEMKSVYTVARANKLKIHIDGARLLNASISSGISADKFSAMSDSVWIDFTKGLGAPLGAVLAGSKDFILEARRHKHIFGGAMRQAGIVAAGCLYALDHHVTRLKEDHDNAQTLAKELSALDEIRVINETPESNMVFFTSRKPSLSNEFILSELSNNGVSLSKVGDKIRAVTHLDVSREDIFKTIEILKKIIRDTSPEGKSVKSVPY